MQRRDIPFDQELFDPSSPANSDDSYRSPASIIEYPDDSMDSDFEEQQVFLWNPVWGFFRDELSLQKLTMEKLAYDRTPILIQGLDGLVESSKHVTFDAETAGISFREWIDQLTPVLSNEDEENCQWRAEYEGK